MRPHHRHLPLSHQAHLPREADINEVTENLKKRLQASLDENTTSTTPSLLGYVGTVKDVIKDTLVIEDKDGKKDIKVTADTAILRSPGNTAIKTENIRIDDYIIAIGEPSDVDVMTGLRLIVSQDPIAPPSKTSGLGTVTKLGKTSITLEVDGKEVVMTLNTKTIFKSRESTLDQSDLSVGDTLIYTATIDEDEDLTATILMQIAKK